MSKLENDIDNIIKKLFDSDNEFNKNKQFNYDDAKEEIDDDVHKAFSKNPEEAMILGKKLTIKVKLLSELKKRTTAAKKLLRHARKQNIKIHRVDFYSYYLSLGDGNYLNLQNASEAAVQIQLELAEKEHEKSTKSVQELREGVGFIRKGMAKYKCNTVKEFFEISEFFID